MKTRLISLVAVSSLVIFDSIKTYHLATILATTAASSPNNLGADPSEDSGIPQEMPDIASDGVFSHNLLTDPKAQHLYAIYSC